MHLRAREEAVDDLAVRGVLGRVEVQRWAAAGEGELGHDVLHRGRVARIGQHVDDVVALQCEPNLKTVRITVRDATQVHTEEVRDEIIGQPAASFLLSWPFPR